MANPLDNYMDKVYNVILVWLNNHTRTKQNLILALFAFITLLSCSDGKYDFGFKSPDDALGCYQKFCTETKGKKSFTSKEVVPVLNEWHEVRDTVLAYLQKDSAYYAHSWIPYKYSSIDDSIRFHLLNIMLEQNYTMKDIAIIKRGSSLYAQDEDVIKSAKEIQPFFSRLDSIHIYNTNKESILSMYRDFLSVTLEDGVSNLDQLKVFVKIEDRIFRTFLHHLAEMDGENLSDITKDTEEICNGIFRSASQEKLDSKETLLYMSMRSNRRILLNAETCINAFRSHKKMAPSQLNAYYWMSIQPFVAIDPFGMAMLSDNDFERICNVADEVHRIDRNGQTGEDSGKLSQMIKLILKMYLTTY